MTDILFTQSYFLRFDPKEWKAMTPYPPLGTTYAAACTRQAGYSVALFDSMLAESEKELIPWIERTSPRYLVIYDDDFNYLTKMCLTRMREAAFRMAKMGKERGLSVIIHSSDATDHVEEYLDAGVDYVMVGEAEETLVELLETLTGKANVPVEEIAGLAFRKEDGVLHQARKRQVLRDLDRLPFPARDLIDIEQYRTIWQKHHGYFSMNMVTTRGCPFHCNWCAKPLYGQVYHSHSPERIAEEMEEIKKKWNPDHIWFCDDIFGLKPGWIEKFAEEVERRKSAIPFKSLSRADLLLRGETVRALRRAGCQTVWIGAESGSQKILDAMEKGTTVEQIYEAARLLKEEGIRVGFFLQFGYPGEENEAIHATLRMVRRALPDEIGISVSYPLPGTRFYQQVLAEMGEKQNWSESADLAMMFRGAYSTEFYRLLSKYIHKDHRLRLGLQALKGMLRTHRVPTLTHLRRMALTPYYGVMRGIYRLKISRLSLSSAKL
ncbi:MAG: B12-binding domain-containing radical SAM protein [Ignavibacteriae bacterium]|nr:B12-binding domain-containing radical SAM protein [Ignavibacteriota bacterium]